MIRCPFSHVHPAHIVLGGIVSLGILLSSPRTAAGASGNMANHRFEACGPVALREALSLLACDVNATECADLAGTDVNGVTPMEGLLRAAQSLKVPARALHLTPHELALIDAPAILHASLPRDRDHFVVFRGAKDARLDISDPSNKVHSMLLTPSQLGLMWDGRCVVFARQPRWAVLKVSVHRARTVLAGAAGLALGIVGASYVLARMAKRGRTDDSGARRERTVLVRMVGIGAAASVVLLLLYVWTAPQRLRGSSPVLLGADVLDLGEIDWMTSSVTSLWISNQGQGPVEVYNGKIQSSSAWIRARASKPNLAPGAKGELKITVRPQRKVGPFAHSVLIPFSGNAGVAPLKIRGSVSGPGTAYPPRLYLGRVKPRQALHRKLFYFARKPDAHVREIRCGSHPVEAHFVSRNAFVTEIEVVLSAPTAAGTLRDALEIITDDRPQARVVVPLEGTVLSEATDRNVERTHLAIGGQPPLSRGNEGE
jgi:hypothetical protein